MIRIGIGGCELTTETLSYAYDRLSEKDEVLCVDEGSGYQGKNVSEKIFGEWVKDKDRSKIYLIDKLPLFDQHYKEMFGWSIYEANNEQLEYGIRETLKKQLEYLNTGYLDCYMLHALFDLQHSKDYDIEKDIRLYKRITPILLKLKEEGLVKSLGYSAHITFERLSYFLSEVDPNNEIFTVAEVSYNILNSSGSKWLRNQTGIMVWDAIGEKGIKYLKDKGYTVICCMPMESGRVCLVNTSKPFLNWAKRFVLDNKDLDIILAGTKSVKHLQEWYDCEDRSAFKVPDMRDLGIEGVICGVNA